MAEFFNSSKTLKLSSFLMPCQNKFGSLKHHRNTHKEIEERKAPLFQACQGLKLIEMLLLNYTCTFMPFSEACGAGWENASLVTFFCTWNCKDLDYLASWLITKIYNFACFHNYFPSFACWRLQSSDISICDYWLQSNKMQYFKL